jgi:putative zinc ribbon protein
MPAPLQRGPFCQSCSMPLSNPDDFGTDQQGFRVNDYCRHCFTDGAFTEPGITLAEMITRGATIMDAKGIMPAPQARALLVEVLPHFRRWRELEAAGAVRTEGGRGLSGGDEVC